MTMKYARLLVKFHNRGLLVLAFILVSAIAFATRAQAIETDPIPTVSKVVTASAACTTAKPSLDLSPGSRDAGVSANLTYTISVTNHDDKACDASSFDLTITYLPDGWTGDLSTPSLNLGPGAMGTAILTVTPADDSETDRSKLQVAVSDARVSMHAKTTMTSLVIGDPTTKTANVVALPVPEEPDTGESSNPAEQVSYNDVSIPTLSNGIVEVDNQAEKAAQQTLRLTGLLTAYNQASDSAKANALEELVAAAEERHALLASLMEDDPGAVLRIAVPTNVRESMPAEVRPLIEQRLNLKGELEVLYKDYADGRASLHHSLKANGEHVAMHFAANPPELLSGERVAVNGVFLDIDNEAGISGTMALESGKQILMLAAGGGSDGGSNGGIPAPLPNGLGEQRTLVIAVNFQDKPYDQPWLIAEVQDAFFGTVNSFIKENSYGHAWLSGDVYGWFTIPLESSTCDQMQIEAAAWSAAESAGAVLSDYSHFLYVFPQTNSCAWSGTSTVGGNPSRTWINGDLRLEIIGHEFGHGLGLYHAHSWSCEGMTLGDSCTWLEYGDGLDIMGWSAAGHFSTFNKERLGWLNNGDTPPITIATNDGTYVLDPYEPDGSNPKALKIYKGIDAITGKGVWYYLEYRQAIGNNMMNSDNVLNGLVFRTGSPEKSGGTGFLLDMTPETYQLYTTDPTLMVGRQYTDSESGISVSTLWADGNSMGVGVSFGSQTCVHINPGLVLSPTESQWVAPGTSVSFAINVANNDGGSCEISTFDLQATAPPGWIVELDNNSLQLSPGTSGTVNMIVTSPQTAVEGYYDITITASENGDPSLTSSAIATYIINNFTSDIDDQPPTTPTGLVATETTRQVDLSWSSSSDNVGVAGYRVLRNDVVINDIVDTTYSDRSLENNVLYEYRIVAYDTTYNVSGVSDPVIAGKAKKKGLGGGKGKGNNK